MKLLQCHHFNDYEVATLFPAQIVDLATLTGACVVALGHDVGGMDLALCFYCM